jgi:hypothetical protein
MEYFELKNIVHGTEFRYEGKEYKKGIICEGIQFILRDNGQYLGPRSDNGRAALCHPKLGGQYQTSIKVWINEETKVGIQ